METTPAPIDTLVVSCYELGHPPLAAASALAHLARSGRHAAAIDLAVEPLERLEEIAFPEGVRLVAVSTPMHAALRVGTEAAARIRRAFPGAHLCFFGLYAWLNAEHLLDGACDSVIGGEFEEPLVGLAAALALGASPDEVQGVRTRRRSAKPHIARQPFAVPARDGLPPLARYSRLEVDGASRPAGAVEASRGCLHTCRHCPIPPVYGGRFFVVPREIVLEDIQALVAAGAQHITFADPDFLNGPGHSLAIVRELHERWPDLTFDVTTKIENVLRHRAKIPELAACGCLFLVTAVESLSDEVLSNLRKGHTRQDVSLATRLLRDAGIVMRPSLLPFTPWSTLEDFVDLVEWVAAEDLVRHVDAVQFSIRLLVPPGSLLLELDSLRAHLTTFRPERFTHDWTHPDPRVDRLHRDVSALVRAAAQTGEDAERTFERVRATAHAAADSPLPVPLLRTGAPAPRLTEPWFC